MTGHEVTSLEKKITIVQNLWRFKNEMFMKLLSSKSWGFLGQLTRVTSRKTKEGVGFYDIEIKGVKSNEPQWYKLNQTFSLWLRNVLM
jgi:hypothetical protein